jgi:hypothetical protein
MHFFAKTSGFYNYLRLSPLEVPRKFKDFTNPKLMDSYQDYWNKFYEINIKQIEDFFHFSQGL